MTAMMMKLLLQKCAMCMCFSARIKQNCLLAVNLIDYNFISSNGHGWWCVTEEKKEASEKKQNYLREDARRETKTILSEYKVAIMDDASDDEMKLKNI